MRRVVVGAGSSGAAPGPAFRGPIQLGYAVGDDWEPSIAADRFGHVYVLWNHYGDDPACPGCPSPHMELQISADGGRMWSSPRPLTPSPPSRQDDPQIVVDAAGGRAVYAGFMQGGKSSQFVARSDDFGRRWRPVLTDPLERGTDTDILAARGEDVYLVYNAVQKIYASVSHDGGQTWSLRRVVHNRNSKLGWSLPAGGAIDSKGKAYFSWAGYTQNGKPSADVNLFVTKSTDGGLTWSAETQLSRFVSGYAYKLASPLDGCLEPYGDYLELDVDGSIRTHAVWGEAPSYQGPGNVWCSGQ